MRAAWELALDVPGDLSIVGYDDEPDARFLRPALTTIRQPQYEMGAKAATLLFERIGQQCPAPATSYAAASVQPQLIVRETTTPPKAVQRFIARSEVAQ